ncbi:MAG: hypothetical protein ACKO96_23940 [Flammeovirgaceae bacterium]
MKAYYLIFFVVTLSCCSDEAILDGTKIVSIKHSENPLGLLPKAKEWEEKFFYNDFGTIVKMSETLSPASYRAFEYNQNGRLFRIMRYDETTNSILSRDSLTYIGNAQYQDRLLIFSKNLLVNPIIYRYYYDSIGQLVQRETITAPLNQVTVLEKYFWADGNIVRKQTYRYNPNRFLAYEFFYEYDSKINYKKDKPMYISDPLSQTKNNVVKESFNDHYGDWEALCNPCTTDYKYNASSLPFLINASWGSRIEIKYE